MPQEADKYGLRQRATLSSGFWLDLANLENPQETEKGEEQSHAIHSHSSLP